MKTFVNKKLSGRSIFGLTVTLVFLCGVLSAPLVTPLIGSLSAEDVGDNEKVEAENNVTLALLQCLDDSCAQSSPIHQQEALKLETAVWDAEKKQGLVVLKEQYKEPNEILFKNLISKQGIEFNHLAFSPSRSMQELYDVDRLTLWPRMKSSYIKRIKKGHYEVKLPRRPGTFLLELAGLDLKKFFAKRIAESDLDVRATELLTGDEARDQKENPVVDTVKEGTAVSFLDSFRDQNKNHLVKIEYGDAKSGWVNGKLLRSMKITAVREFLGISFSFFGLLAHEGFYVRWNNKDYVAFANMTQGGAYELEFSEDNYTFSKTRYNYYEAAAWKALYEPLVLEANGK